MKKRLGFILFFGVLLACFAAAPVFAQPNTIVINNAAFSIAVTPDGRQQVTQTMDVTLPQGSTGFSWAVCADPSANGFRVEEMRVSGTLAATVEEDRYQTVATLGNGAAQGNHQVVLEYALVPSADLDPDADYLLFDCLGNNWEFDVQALEAEFILPDGAVPQITRVLEDLWSEREAEGFSIAPTATGFLLKSTPAADLSLGAAVLAQFANGTFALPAARNDNFVSENVCTVELTPDMVYHVTQRVVVQTAEKNTFLLLPTLEFEDYTTAYTAQLVSHTGPIAVQETRWKDSALSLYLEGDAAGAYTAEYTYTLRPARVTAPLALRFRVPYWATHMAQASFALRAPGLSDAQTTMEYSLLRTPSEKRFSASFSEAEGNDATVQWSLLYPLYAGEELLLTAQHDSTLYHRVATPLALGCVVFGVVVFLIALAGKFLFGLARPITATPEAAPPEGVNCAEFGYLLDGVLTNSELAGLVLQWGAEGALTIERTGEEYIFKRTGKPAGKDAYEIQLFEAMFACGQDGYVTTVQLRGRFAALATTARMALLQRYTRKQALAPFGAFQFFLSLASLLPTAAVVFVGAFALGNGIAISLACAAGGLLAQLCLCILCRWAFPPQAGARPRGNAGLGLRVAFRCIVALLLLLFGFGFRGLLPETPLWVFLCVLGLSTAACALGRTFLGRSAQTHALLCRILGFSYFLCSNSQSDFANNQGADAAYFYKMLPYTIAMGAQETWLASFATLSVPAPPFWEQCQSNADCVRCANHLVAVLRAITMLGAR